MIKNGKKRGPRGKGKQSGRKAPNVVVVKATCPPRQNKRPRGKKALIGPKSEALPGVVDARGGGAYHLSGDVSWGIPGLFGGRLQGGMSDGKVTGTGAYHVKRNSLMPSIDMTGTVPRVSNQQNSEAFVVSHREFLKDVTSGVFEVGSTDSTEFTVESWSLNPANTALFPWLSSIAGNFQEYQLRGCLVEYKTTCSDLSTTLNLGSVIMTADYNVLADGPVNKQLMENMENAGSCKPSMSLIMPIEYAKSLTSVSTHLYVGPIDAADGDLRLYDLCKIYFASMGIPRERVKIGEFWVTYEVAFYKPKLLMFPVYQQNLSWVTQWSSSSVSTPFGGTRITMPDSSPSFDFDEEGHVLFPDDPGQLFFVSAYWTTTVTATGRGVVPSILGANLEVENIFYDGDDATTVDVEETPAPPDSNFVKSMHMNAILKATRADVTQSRPSLYFGTDGDFTTAKLTISITLWNRNWVARSPSGVLKIGPPTCIRRAGGKSAAAEEREAELREFALFEEWRVRKEEVEQELRPFRIREQGIWQLERPNQELTTPTLADWEREKELEAAEKEAAYKLYLTKRKSLEIPK